MGLHQEIDKQVARREHRFQDAAMRKDTQWDLVAAAVEVANIDYHGLAGRDATNMKGRSEITLMICEEPLGRHGAGRRLQ